MLFFVTRLCDSNRAAYFVSRRWYSVRASGKIDVTKTIETESPSDDTPPIPPLSRPLGVPDVPTTKVKTLSERSADFLNQEKQLEKRRHLYVGTLVRQFVHTLMIACEHRVKEASTGYFYDLHMTRVHGGKTWMAPKVLIREDVRVHRSFSCYWTYGCIFLVESTIFPEHCWQSSR